jgi:haloalkane dehalogenase
MPILPEDPYIRKYTEVLGSRMAYIDEGQGDALVFLHGNPASSYLWRNIIPHLSSQYRCIAPDLIGMGRSDKPDIGYRFVDHARYIAAFLDALELQRITFVLHDWGSALGFDWAVSHPERVHALAFLEAIIAPVPSWDAFSDVARPTFQGFRTPEVGERLVYDENVFIERMLPGSIVRKLSEAELDQYRAPFRVRNARKPMLVWPRELPIAGEPADVIAIVERYRTWLTQSSLPKLLLTADPGGLIRAPLIAWCQQNLPNLEVASVGAGIHYLQEDNPDGIGRQLATWRASLRL